MSADTKRLVTDAQANAWALHHARWNDGADYVEVPPDDYQALLDTREALIEALARIEREEHEGVDPSHRQYGDCYGCEVEPLLAQLRGDA